MSMAPPPRSASRSTPSMYATVWTRAISSTVAGRGSRHTRGRSDAAPRAAINRAGASGCQARHRVPRNARGSDGQSHLVPPYLSGVVSGVRQDFRPTTICACAGYRRTTCTCAGHRVITRSMLLIRAAPVYGAWIMFPLPHRCPRDGCWSQRTRHHPAEDRARHRFPRGTATPRSAEFNPHLPEYVGHQPGAVESAG